MKYLKYFENKEINWEEDWEEEEEFNFDRFIKTTIIDIRDIDHKTQKLLSKYLKNKGTTWESGTEITPENLIEPYYKYRYIIIYKRERGYTILWTLQYNYEIITAKEFIELTGNFNESVEWDDFDWEEEDPNDLDELIKTTLIDVRESDYNTKKSLIKFLKNIEVKWINNDPLDIKSITIPYNDYKYIKIHKSKLRKIKYLIYWTSSSNHDSIKSAKEFIEHININESINNTNWIEDWEEEDPNDDVINNLLNGKKIKVHRKDWNRFVDILTVDNIRWGNKKEITYDGYKECIYELAEETFHSTWDFPDIDDYEPDETLIGDYYLIDYIYITKIKGNKNFLVRYDFDEIGEVPQEEHKLFENIDFDDFDWEEEEEKEPLNEDNINIGDEVICIKDCANGTIEDYIKGNKFIEVSSNEWYYSSIKKGEVRRVDGKWTNYLWFKDTKHGGYEYKNFEKV